MCGSGPGAGPGPPPSHLQKDNSASLASVYFCEEFLNIEYQGPAPVGSRDSLRMTVSAVRIVIA